jgi:hypothetical protein
VRGRRPQPPPRRSHDHPKAAPSLPRRLPPCNPHSPDGSRLATLTLLAAPALQPSLPWWLPHCNPHSTNSSHHLLSTPPAVPTLQPSLHHLCHLSTLTPPCNPNCPGSALQPSLLPCNPASPARLHIHLSAAYYGGHIWPNKASKAGKRKEPKLALWQKTLLVAGRGRRPGRVSKGSAFLTGLSFLPPTTISTACQAAWCNPAITCTATLPPKVCNPAIACTVPVTTAAPSEAVSRPGGFHWFLRNCHKMHR